MHVKFSVFMIFMISSLLLSYPASAWANLVQVPVEKVYAPVSVDAEEDVEIVVEGYLPNLCYSNPEIRGSVAEKVIKLEVKAHLGPHASVCAMMITPFVRSLTFRKLEKGIYKIIVNGKLREGEVIQIKEGNKVKFNKKPNLSYVESISINENEDNLVINAYRPSECFDKGKTFVFFNGEDAYTLVPTLIKNQDYCPKKMTPVVYELPLSGITSGKRYLIHVLSADNGDVDYFIDR